MTDVTMDLNPIVSVALRILTEPYRDFVEKLRVEGRVTTEELIKLRDEILDRGERLADLTQAELRKSTPEGWAIPRV